MREKKWTQGEWWLSGLEIVVMPLQVKICNMVGGRNREEAKANAQLIAAAPELLQMLEAANQHIKNMYVDSPNPEYAELHMRDYIRISESIINKAYGE